MARGASTFAAGGDAYQRFMGRYSDLLSPAFADAAAVEPGQRALDVGCGTGALTAELVNRLGADSVCGCDPSPMLGYCRERFPAVDLKEGSAEHIPFEDDGFDVALAQLVFHFMTDPAVGLAEMRRTVRSGGRVAGAVWDAEGGMRLLGQYWAAVRQSEPDTGAGETLRFGAAGELASMFREGGLQDVDETEIEVSSTYRDFDELWGTLLLGVGPAGAHLVAQPEERRQVIRSALRDRLGDPDGSFGLGALARVAVGVVPG